MRINCVQSKEISQKESYRIDAEFFDANLMKNEFSFVYDGLIRDLVEPVDQIQKLKNPTHSIQYLEISDIDLTSTNYGTKEIYPDSVPSRATYHLQKDDVVVSTVRPIRNAVALIQSDKLVGTSGFTVLRGTNVESEYLWTFCKTKFFRKYLFRRQRNSMYPAVSQNDILDMPIYLANSKFREAICGNIQKFALEYKKQDNEYRSIQTKLLERLGFKLHHSRKPCIHFGQYKAIRKLGRIDSKYFHPKFEVLERVFNNCSRTVTLEEITSIEKGVEVGKENYLDVGIPFIRVSDVGRYSLKTNKMVTERLFHAYEFACLEEGDILLTKDGTLGLVHYLHYKPDRMLTSSGVVRLRIRDKIVPANYLALVLDTSITLLQIERECSGSNISHWNMTNVKECRVPLLDDEEMKSIDNRLDVIFNKLSDARSSIQKTIELLDCEIDNVRR